MNKLNFSYSGVITIALAGIVVFYTLIASAQDDARIEKMQKAIKWANSHIGKYIQPCTTKGCKYNETQPGDKPCQTSNPAPDEDDKKKGRVEDGHPYWFFYCMRFVRTAYGAGVQSPSANEFYLNEKKSIRTDKDIPIGAIVFWHWSTYGHIGIYVGNGEVVHTGANPNTMKKGVRKSPLTDITEVLDGYNKYSKQEAGKSYLGWAYPPKDWPGRKE